MSGQAGKLDLKIEAETTLDSSELDSRFRVETLRANKGLGLRV